MHRDAQAPVRRHLPTPAGHLSGLVEHRFQPGRIDRVIVEAKTVVPVFRAVISGVHVSVRTNEIEQELQTAGLDIGQTEEAGNGNEALEKLNANAVDIMLCDVNMPEMNGPELVAKVRELPSCENTKIVMVSTESSQELIDDVMAKGANDFITKPFTPEKFQEKLSPFMN